MDDIIKYFNQINSIRELRWAAKEIKKIATNYTTTQYLQLVFEPPLCRFFWIKQIRSEIAGLCELIQYLKPEKILEIGTASGGSLFLLAKNSGNAHLISVDLPEGKFGGGYPEYKIPFFKSFANDNQKIDLLRGDSHDHLMFDRVKGLLGGKPLDVLFIDGDHSYEGVRQDFEMYIRLVSPNGIIVFHDIVKHNMDWGCGVDQLWGELKLKYRYLEFIDSPTQQWAGIGVLFINPDVYSQHQSIKSSLLG